MIVDTNALSDFVEGRPKVVQILATQTSIEVPVIVLGEYQFGLLGSSKRIEYENILNAFVEDVRILRIDEITAKYYAALRMSLRLRGHPIPENDLWIAALARQHDLPILSQDTHFDAVDGVTRIGW